MLRIGFFVCVFLPLLVFGQKNYRLEFAGSSLKSFIKHPETEFKDSTQARAYVANLRTTAISKGYLLASVDSVAYEKQSARVFFYLGEAFESAALTMNPEELSFVSKEGKIPEKLLSRVPFTPREIAETLKKIHATYLNNGYPFATVRLDSLHVDSTSMQASIRVDRGAYMTWQDIHVKGDTAVSVKYISSLLGIKIGDPFNNKLLENIRSSIEQVTFLKEIKPHEILFTPEGCELYMYLESVPISSFNGIVGLQPDPNTKRLSVTGELNLKLLNILKRGELLDIRWQSIRDQTQSLTSQLNYPFLFKSPFGIDATFDLYKRDTSFLELDGTVGVQYYLSKGNYVKAFYQSLSSNVLSGGANNPTFSKLGNSKSNNYGLSFVSNRVDYYPNPSRGIRLTLRSSVGSRNLQISDTSTVQKSTTYRGLISFEWFVPLTRRHVLRLANNSEFYSAENVFQNELYRFGGQNAQRGFNEDELFASTRTTFTAEYRFLLDKNSHVFAFYDQSWYENVAGNYYNDSPFGFGVGFSFRTNVGLFSISYALGKQFDNAIQLNNSKVHFGYIAYF